jgi:cell division protein FtsQ
MLASEPELAPRVTALVLVGERRWNLRIDNAIDVLLPDDEPGQPVGQARTQAWSRLASIERTTQLFQRDVQTVDMRLPDRLVMRVNDAPKDPSPAKKPHPGGKST